MRFWLGMSVCLGLTACVSNEFTFSDKVNIEPVESVARGSSEEVAHKLEFGVENFGPSQQIEWFGCTHKPGLPTFVLLSPESFTKAEVCRHPAAAELLAQGFNVLAINRLGQGASKGVDRMGDETAVELDLQLLAKRKAAGSELKGLWAYGEASVEGFRVAKRFPFTYLVIGDGIYDWEKTLKETQDQDLKNRLSKLEGDSGEADFAEIRSIAWDFGGLPPSIYLYHNTKNLKVAAEQASAFKASLAASEYKVELFLVESAGQELPPPFHRGVIQKILLLLKAPPASAH